MSARPHSISELAQFAKDESPANARSVKDWLRVADALRKQGNQAKEDGDIQAAFLYLARSATYILEKIPHNAGYHDLNPTQKTNLKNNGQDILYSLEQLKPRLADRYEQWLARDPNNAKQPSDLLRLYGAAISPVVRSRAVRQDSIRETRAAVSQEQPGSIRSTVSMGDLSRELNDMRLQGSPEERKLIRNDSGGRRTQDDIMRQWMDQHEANSRRTDEEAAAAARAQEQARMDAARRQWEAEQEMEARRRDEQRRLTEYGRTQQVKDAALAAARKAAAGPVSVAARERPQDASRYQERSIASRETGYDRNGYQQYLTSSHSPLRSEPGYDALPHHPLQDPTLYRDSPQPATTSTPIWEANHTPTSTRKQSLYALSSINTANHIQYPQLMSAHQKAQGYTPSTMFPSPVSSRGGSSSLYNVTLPQPQPQHQQSNQYPSWQATSPQPKYSPAPPPPSTYASQNSVPQPGVYPVDGPTPPPPRMPVRSQSMNVNTHTHKRQGSIPDVLQNTGGMRPIDMPVELLDQFLGVARLNTLRKTETCGLLLGRLRGAGFIITTLLIPEQRGTSDTCIMESEELVVEFSTGRELLTLGWIHTHPTQSCFMSSLDLHTHAAYQSTLKEAIAIVCAPNSEPKFGIFRLTDPPGLEVVMTCQAKETFHPHPDHLAIYTDCDNSHVRLMAGMPLEIVDLRRGQDFSSSEGTRGV